jgi:hypothetical protein
VTTGWPAINREASPSANVRSTCLSPHRAGRAPAGARRFHCASPALRGGMPQGLSMTNRQRDQRAAGGRSVLRLAPAVGEVGVDVEQVEDAADGVVDQLIDGFGPDVKTPAPAARSPRRGARAGAGSRDARHAAASSRSIGTSGRRSLSATSAARQAGRRARGRCSPGGWRRLEAAARIPAAAGPRTRARGTGMGPCRLAACPASSWLGSAPSLRRHALGGTCDQVGNFLFSRMLQPIATSSPTEPSGFCLA